MKPSLWALALGLSLTLLAAQSPAKEAKNGAWLVEDFEGAGGHLGPWSVAANDNGLGTVLEPQPFVPQAGGAPASPGHSGRIHGYLGANKPPYSWAQLVLPLSDDKSPQDLGRFQSLHFWVKGDGKRYVVKLMKASITDFDQFKFEFPAGTDWTELAVPFSAFNQAGWGQVQPRDFNDVTSVQFEAGVNEATYDLQVDQVTLSPAEASLEPEPYDTRTWFPYQGYQVAKRRGTALDASGRLDPPAGKHGWVQPKGEDFTFQKTGKPVRFFGVDLVAGSNFPTHAQADSMAEALAEMGVNITRHHHADAPWSTHNFFGKLGSTRRLDPESMDRFDYLVAQLQKRGIYQYFDLLVHREALADDGIKSVQDVVNGWKIEGEYDPTLIDLQMEFTRQLMTHKNPYTGKVYGMDPAIAGMEIINEDSLWFRQGGKGDFATTTPYYQGVYQGLFNRWLVSRYKDRAALALAWAPSVVARQGLGDDEDPKAGSVKAVPNWDPATVSGLSVARAKDGWAFDGYLMERYFSQRLKLLRSLGYQGPVTGSNHWVSHPADLALNARMNFIDRHAYWGHPQGGWDYGPNVTFDPDPMIKHPDAGIIGELAARRVKGLPFIASEWSSAAPNDYRADSVLDMGLACGFQNWSAIQFAYNDTDQTDFDTYKGVLRDHFNVIDQPVWMALWPAVTTILQRGDIKTDDGPGAWTAFSRAELDDPGLQRQGTGTAAFAARTGVTFSPYDGQSPAQARQAATQDGWVTSSTGQIRHNPDRGLLTLQTERSAAVAGFSGGQGPLQAGALGVDVKSPYAVIVLCSLDDAPLGQSRRLLLVAGSNAVNTGMVKRWGGGAMVKAGTAPVLVEPVLASVSLACDAPRQVWSLDSDGQREQKVDSSYADGTLGFTLSAEQKALAWEIDGPAAP